MRFPCIVLLSLLVLSISPDNASAAGLQRVYGGEYLGGFAGWLNVLKGQEEAHSSGTGVMFGPRMGVYRSRSLAFEADLGVTAGIIGESHPRWFVDLPTLHGGFGAGGKILLIMLGFGITPLGLDGLDDGVTFSVLNPRGTMGVQVNLPRVMIKLEGHVERLIRLGDASNATWAGVTLTLGSYGWFQAR